MRKLPTYSSERYHPVIRLPEGYEVYDFSKGYDADRFRKSPYGIGKYDERRPGMYETELFNPGSPALARDVHMAIDIGAPEGEPVYAFYDGKIHSTAINSLPGDYGGTIVTEHEIDGVKIWALHGHLSHASLALHAVRSPVKKGALIGFVGAKSENGGWNPHLHFQLSYVEPDRCDMPGAVSISDREKSLSIYPDPRLILGPLY